MLLKKKKPLSLEKKTRWFGLVFMLPWIIGLVYFFLIPFTSSVLYSFNSVSLGENNLEMHWVGLDNYRYMLGEEAEFTRNVTDEVVGLFRDVPIIIIFSLFISLILNQKFKGRLLARSLFFLPVIIASGVVIEVISNDLFTKTGLQTDENTIFQIGIISNLFENMNMPEERLNFLVTAVAQIFDLTWKSGVQILLFLSALQRIPTTYYEVAAVEGANAWESFWRITFPVLSPICLLTGVYTIVDTFTDTSNEVMGSIITRFGEMKYGFASASAVIYFLVIGVVLALVMAVFGKRTQNT